MREVRCAKCDARCPMRDVRCATCNARCAMRDARCAMCDARSAMRDARCAMCHARRATRRQRAKCGMRGARCAVRHAPCAVRHARCAMCDVRCTERKMRNARSAQCAVCATWAHKAAKSAPHQDARRFLLFFRLWARTKTTEGHRALFFPLFLRVDGPPPQNGAPPAPCAAGQSPVSKSGPRQITGARAWRQRAVRVGDKPGTVLLFACDRHVHRTPRGDNRTRTDAHLARFKNWAHFEIRSTNSPHSEGGPQWFFFALRCGRAQRPPGNTPQVTPGTPRPSFHARCRANAPQQRAPGVRCRGLTPVFKK